MVGNICLEFALMKMLPSFLGVSVCVVAAFDRLFYWAQNSKLKIWFSKFCRHFSLAPSVSVGTL